MDKKIYELLKDTHRYLEIELDYSSYDEAAEELADRIHEVLKEHKPKGTLEYYSNNSGGYDWLSILDWHALEDAGWNVASDRRHATIETDDPVSKVKEFEQLTGEDAGAIGCTCCGPPHNFSYEDSEGNTSYLEREIRTDWSF